MSWELLGAFTVFAIVTLFTPGPNNLMLLTSGVNFGLRRALPHLLGVALGFPVMVAVIGFGLGALFTAWPPLYTVIKYVGAAYLLYLAWLIAHSGAAMSTGPARGRPISFLEAAAFQWVNPKAWVMAVGAISSYAALTVFPFNIVTIAVIFAVLGLISAAAWVGFGTSLRPLLARPRLVRTFNIAMAVALVLSIVPVFLE
jgi:threonine/homoserine/homoserine lactone efflux protein